jgi:2-polyprenyl-6-methoxyphenol hydroxylase-like FAD-dependent oxidoreductase
MSSGKEFLFCALRQLLSAACAVLAASSAQRAWRPFTPFFVYRRPPIFRWAKGRVALLGDSAHAMQPNLGQGGCMAIEDAFQLGRDVAAGLKKVSVEDLSLATLGLPML